MSGLAFPRLLEPPSAETTAFNAWLRDQLAQLPKAHEVPPEVTRKARDDGAGIFLSGGPLDGSEWGAIPGAPGGAGRVRISAPERAARGVYLHIHGGGWTFNRPDYYDLWNQRIARETGLAVVSAAYRLAPEHPWPACAEDCEAAARWLIETAPKQFGTDRLLIGGESAGAHLAAVTLLRLRTAGLMDRFAGAALTYGVFDLRMTPSMIRGVDAPIVPTETVSWFTDNLTAEDVGLRADPALSPLLADLAGFPPTLIACGAADPLLDDSLLMATALARGGTAVETRLYPGGVHAFDQFDTPLAEEALADRTAWLSRAGA